MINTNDYKKSNLFVVLEMKGMTKKSSVSAEQKVLTPSKPPVSRPGGGLRVLLNLQV